MTDETPREYGREYIKTLSHEARVRLGHTIEAGGVRRFIIQLECRIKDEWLPVGRDW